MWKLIIDINGVASTKITSNTRNLSPSLSRHEAWDLGSKPAALSTIQAAHFDFKFRVKTDTKENTVKTRV